MDKEKIMRKEFILIRHGETDGNKNGRPQGRYIDMSLNQNGIKQANNLLAILESKNLEAIYSSPLKRAYETANIIANNFSLPNRIINDLIEMDYKAEDKEELFKFFYDVDMNSRHNSGENKIEAQERMLNVLKGLLKEDFNIAGLVTHTGSLLCLLRSFGVVPSPDQMGNSALFKVIYENGVWSAEIL